MRGWQGVVEGWGGWLVGTMLEAATVSLFLLLGCFSFYTCPKADLKEGSKEREAASYCLESVAP